MANRAEKRQQALLSAPLGGGSGSDGVGVGGIPAHLLKAGGVRRFTPAQERALARLRHSQEVWSRHAAEQAEQAAERQQAAERKQAAEDFSSFDVWAAAVAGKTMLIKDFVARTNFDVRSRDRSAARNGDTLLHIAAWHGHESLVNYLIEQVKAMYGDAELRAFVNSMDSSCARITPLILAARTEVGYLKPRLMIVKALINAGADASFGDVHVLNTDSAVFASSAENNSGQKPVDIAQARAEALPSVATHEVYRLLLNMMRACNVRLKIQNGKIRRLLDASRKQDVMVASRAKLLLDAAALLEAAQKESVRQHTVAEEQRNTEEIAFMEEKGAAAIAEMEVWVTNDKKGKATLEAEYDKVYRQMKEEAKKAGHSVDRDTKRIATAKAKAILFAAEEARAKEKAQAEFRRKNPPTKISASG